MTSTAPLQSGNGWATERGCQISRGAPFLALVMIVAAISRIPLIEELESFKIAIFGAELLGLLTLFSIMRRKDHAAALLAVTFLVIVLRLVLGTMIATAISSQPIGMSLQEARFGLMLGALPLAYLYLRDASNRQLKRFLVAYLTLLITIDVAVFLVMRQEALLVLGARTEARFVISIVPAFVVTALLVIRQKAEGSCRLGVAFPVAILMLAHAALVSTSRVEMLLSAGLVGFVLCARWPVLRWLIYLAVYGVGLAIAVQTLFGGEGFAGRDFQTAIDLALRSGGHGLGFIRDSSARIVFGLPESFFLSDYGALLYILRYGLLGLVIVYGLFVVWLAFALQPVGVKGKTLLSGPILLYLAYIPSLDYGSLMGGLLLAFMLVPRPVAAAHSRIAN